MRYLALLCTLTAVLVTGGCAATRLPMERIAGEPSEMPGTFSLVVYGQRFAKDLLTVAILDLEGDEYEIVPYGQEFFFRTVATGLSAEQALDKAVMELKENCAYSGRAISRISTPEGATVGYDVVPIYHSGLCEFAGSVSVTNWLEEGNKVRVNVHMLMRGEFELMDHHRD